MDQILMKVSDIESNGSLLLWSLGGFIIAASIACAGILPDFFNRLHWAINGGVGETAIWGEPQFFIAIMGMSAGLVGVSLLSPLLSRSQKHPNKMIKGNVEKVG